jgi:hypothetical protein
LRKYLLLPPFNPPPFLFGQLPLGLPHFLLLLSQHPLLPLVVLLVELLYILPVFLLGGLSRDSAKHNKR